MGYDEVLAGRIRDLIGPDPELTEKKMFGGRAFLIRGHMAITASGQGGVLVHVDPGRSDDLAAMTAATVAVMRGREMAGWLRVAAADVATDDALGDWVELGLGYARSLPPKQPARKPRSLTAAAQELNRGACIKGPNRVSGGDDNVREPISASGTGWLGGSGTRERSCRL